MEIKLRRSFIDRLKAVFLKDPIPFSTRREVNWKALKRAFVCFTTLIIVGLLLVPNEPVEQSGYHEMTASGSEGFKPAAPDPSLETLHQLSQARVDLVEVPKAVDSVGLIGRHHSSSELSRSAQNTSMIIVRPGFDSRLQLPPGSQIFVKLSQRAIVGTQDVPVIGVVTRDFVHEDGVAIERGAKLFGKAQFDDRFGRAQLTWNSIQFLDGGTRSIEAVGSSLDGRTGIEGIVHSDGLKNVAGRTLSRFVGAYAEGSMERGVLGSSPGGANNGWKNAIAETAKDQTERWAEDLKRENKWIELTTETESIAMLTQPFTFKAPGGSHE